MSKNSLECKICSSNMTISKTAFGDMHTICGNGCYEEIATPNCKSIFYIFGERMTVDLNDINTILKQMIGVNEKIDYWKHGERYLIKILEGYTLQSHAIHQIKEQYGMAVINSKAIARIRID